MSKTNRPKKTQRKIPVKRPLTLKIPEAIHAKLKQQKFTTGQSIQAAVIAALEASPPPPPHSPDVEYWLSVKEQKKGLPRPIILDRLLVWLMRHESETQKEVI